jgi:3-oxoacyl-[acyl-carrier protein] reductase
MKQLQDKVVVITGGGRGIGATIAEACAAEGARVLIAARSADELKKTCQEIKAKNHGTVEGVVCDVSREDQIREMFAAAERMGPLYGLICAAGIYGPIGPFEENPIEDWVRAVEINLIGTARCIHAAIPGMKIRKEGRIVLFSGGGQGALPNFSSYVTGKGGIWRLNETLGAELAPYGIYMNAISPGAVNTKFLDELLAAGPAKVGKVFYEKALKQRDEGGASPEKAADLAIYFLTDASKGLYGKNLSALWDNYREFSNLEALSKAELYTMRRVVESK